MKGVKRYNDFNVPNTNKTNGAMLYASLILRHPFTTTVDLYTTVES
jgi:hypothetical protein